MIIPSIARGRSPAEKSQHPLMSVYGYDTLQLNMYPQGWFGANTAYLWLCCAISMALRAGTGEPPSVTLKTSMDFRSGRRFPCRFSIGESTRFRGGSAANWGEKVV